MICTILDGTPIIVDGFRWPMNQNKWSFLICKGNDADNENLSQNWSIMTENSHDISH